MWISFINVNVSWISTSRLLHIAVAFPLSQQVVRFPHQSCIVKKCTVSVCEREIFMTHSSTTTHLVHRIPPLPGDAHTYSLCCPGLGRYCSFSRRTRAGKKVSPGIYMLGGKMCVKVEIYEVDSQIKDFLLSSRCAAFEFLNSIHDSVSFNQIFLPSRWKEKESATRQHVKIFVNWAGVKSEIKKEKRRGKSFVREFSCSERVR